VEDFLPLYLINNYIEKGGILMLNIKKGGEDGKYKREKG